MLKRGIDPNTVRIIGVVAMKAENAMTGTARSQYTRRTIPLSSAVKKERSSTE